MLLRHLVKTIGLTALFFLSNSIYSQECSPDVEGPTITCKEEFVTYILEGFDPQAEVIADKVLSVVGDNCSANEDLYIGISTDLDSEDPPITTSILLGEGNWPVVIWAVDEANNTSSCFTTVTVELLEVVEVVVFEDTNGDCIQNPGEEGIPNWPVQFSTLTDVVSTDPSTSFTNGEGKVLYWIQRYFDYENDIWTFELLLPGGLSLTCPNIASFSPMSPPDIIYFGMQGQDSCADLYVDISTFRLRPCFGTVYDINYCNYSDELVADVEVVVELDYGIIVENASVPYTDLGNNVLVFSIGDLGSLDCGQIKINASVDCDIPTGITQCARAEIKPFGCDAINESYNGPSLVISGECDEDNETVNFQIANIGEGDMTEEVDYVVVEDVVMFMESPIQLNSLQSIDLPPLPANGATWRLSVPQPDGHPGFSNPSFFIEGCGGLSSGMVNLFPLDEADPNIAIHCEVTSGSFDPNDKQAFPRGYGDENFIEANTAIEYLIRFQNTGTDTAFNVRIEDQLDSQLAWETIRGGGASHSYRMSIDESGLVQFYFDDIMLPDSNVSEINSHGFVQFWIEQKPDNPLGTVLQNEAAIYFDFNEPIITNTVSHTIGEDFIITATIEVNDSGLEVLLYPNPFWNQAHFTLKGRRVNNAQLLVYNNQGQLIREEAFMEGELLLDRKQLTNGIYFFQIMEETRILASGKLLVH